MKRYERNLLTFARNVLRIMEQDEDWSADTLDEISGLAYELGLAGNNEYGYFTRTAEIEEYTYRGQEPLDLN